jgi:metal-responsive CopG/Arc/MetJ family transcriptional regulator
MVSKHVKIALSIPEADFARIERNRRQLKMTRSEFMVTAVRRWFEANEQTRLVDQYVQGYTVQPEEPHIISALESSQVREQAAEEW